VRRHNLEVLESPATVRQLVFNANVWEVHVAVDEREIVLSGPLRDLALSVVSFTCLLIASAVPVQVSQETLVITLELIIQDDSTNVSSTITESLARVEICSVQLRIVRELSRLHDACVEGLCRLVSVAFSMRLENVTSTIRQRHQGCFAIFDDVRDRPHEAKLAQVPKVAIARVGGSAVMVSQVVRRHDSECACGREDANLRLAQVVHLASVANRPTRRPSGQV
jgi:hypothetical protein